MQKTCSLVGASGGCVPVNYSINRTHSNAFGNAVVYIQHAASMSKTGRSVLLCSNKQERHKFPNTRDMMQN